MFDFRFSLLLLYFVIFNTLASAQDTIYTLNQKTTHGKVTEISQDEITYSLKYKNKIVTDKFRSESVFKIVYANGWTDTISKQRGLIEIEKRNKQNQKVEFGKVNVYVTVTDFYFGLISGGLSYTFADGYIAVEVPLSFGMIHMGLLDSVATNSYNYTDDFGKVGYFNPYKKYSTGLNVNVFTMPAGKVRLYFNLSFGTGQFTYTAIAEEPGHPYSSVYKEQSGSYSSLFTKVGVLVRPTKHFNFSFNLGPGVYETRYSRYLPFSNTTYSETRVKGGLQGGLHVGYCFW